jgi:hypothetical protein
VLLALSSSHCTQNIADCNDKKFTSVAVNERCIQMIPSGRIRNDEGKQSRAQE